MKKIINIESIEKVKNISFSTETITLLKCPVCGHSYKKNEIGRTREYCSTNCQEFNKFKDAMIARMRNVDFNDKEARLIRREFWGYANIAKIATKKK